MYIFIYLYNKKSERTWLNLTCAQGIIPAGVCFILIDIQFLRLEMRIKIKIHIHIDSKYIEMFISIVNRLLPKNNNR